MAIARTSRRRSPEPQAALLLHDLFGVCVVTVLGRLVSANDTLARMLGYESGAAMLDPSVDGPFRHQALLTRMMDQYLDEGSLSYVQADLMRLDGGTAPTWLSGRLVTTELDEPAFELIVQPIPQRRAGDGQGPRGRDPGVIRRSTVNAVTHDLRSILTVIRGSATFIKAELPAHHPHNPWVDKIREATGYAADLLKQLTKRPGQHTEADGVLELSAVVADSRDTLEKLFCHRVRLEMHLDDLPLPIRISKDDLARIVFNLLVNARDATPDGGRVTIETRRAGRTPPLGGSGWVLEGALLTVTDTGSGMDARTQARALEPFFTTKPVGVGTGLGLSTVAEIVQRAGGRVTLRSEVGEGTTVEIWLPLALRDVEVGTDTVLVEQLRKGSVRKPLILLVEDEATVASVAGSALNRQGYEVLTACDGQEALSLCEASHARDIAMVVTDVRLPRMEGPELAARMRAIRPDMPVLFTSGFHDELEHLVNEEGVGMTYVLEKPFDPQDLCGRVKLLLEESAAAGLARSSRARMPAG